MTREEREAKLQRTLNDAEALIKNDGYKSFVIAIHADVDEEVCTCVGAVGSTALQDMVHMVSSGTEAINGHVLDRYGKVGLMDFHRALSFISMVRDGIDKGESSSDNKEEQ